MTHPVNKNKAIFLDRDGVINREKGHYIYRPEDFELNADIFEALRLFRDKGFILIVITNQSGIAQNLYSHSQVEKIHGILKERLYDEGIELEEIYYCPHHPSAGKCLCRKPESLLLEKAVARFSIDRSLSYMIGDKERDIMAAQKAGIKGILIGANESILKYAKNIGQDSVDQKQEN